MYSPSDTEIAGGVGFGYDQFPSEYDHHTDYSLYANGSRIDNRDPYLPVLSEEMGREWSGENFSSSTDTRGRSLSMENTLEKPVRVYPYRNIYSLKDPLRVNRYYLDSSGGRERLMSNFPSFHATEPFLWSRGEGEKKGGLPEGNALLLLLFVLVVVMAALQFYQFYEIKKLRALTLHPL